MKNSGWRQGVFLTAAIKNLTNDDKTLQQMACHNNILIIITILVIATCYNISCCNIL